MHSGINEIVSFVDPYLLMRINLTIPIMILAELGRQILLTLPIFGRILLTLS